MNSIMKYLNFTMTMAEWELRKLWHDPSQIVIRSVQPALWIVVFGSVFSKIREIPTGGISYLQFMTPGILAQSVMFVAIFYGIALVWERDMGLLAKLLSTPAPRSAIVLGKAFSAGIRGALQAVAILILAAVIGVNFTYNPVYILGVFVIVILFGMCFSSLSMCLVSVFRTRERMMGIGQVITMPLFFASNAIYPISLMPEWLKYITYINPISYTVDAMRALLVTGDFSNLWLDILAITAITAVMIILASMTFRKIVA
jgi:ABC-2 type transport system permease protein